MKDEIITVIKIYFFRKTLYENVFHYTVIRGNLSTDVFEARTVGERKANATVFGGSDLRNQSVGKALACFSINNIHTKISRF